MWNVAVFLHTLLHSPWYLPTLCFSLTPCFHGIVFLGIVFLGPYLCLLSPFIVWYHSLTGMSAGHACMGSSSRLPLAGARCWGYGRTSEGNHSAPPGCSPRGGYLIQQLLASDCEFGTQGSLSCVLRWQLRDSHIRVRYACIALSIFPPTHPCNLLPRVLLDEELNMQMCSLVLNKSGSG